MVSRTPFLIMFAQAVSSNSNVSGQEMFEDLKASITLPEFPPFRNFKHFKHSSPQFHLNRFDQQHFYFTLYHDKGILQAPRLQLHIYIPHTP